MKLEKIRETIEKHYETFLEREATEKEIQYYLTKIKDENLSIDDLTKIFKNSEEYARVQKKYEDLENLDSDFEKILSQETVNEEIVEGKNEAQNIFVSSYNEDTKEGGIFVIKNEKLSPVFTEQMCNGLDYYAPEQILFGVKKSEPQLVALKIDGDNFKNIPIIFENYIFARDPHGIFIRDNKIFVVASNGDESSPKATQSCVKDGDFVGKIIVSEIDFGDSIHIKNSKVYDPFGCTHHHHINDICFHNGEMFLTSMTYCDENNEYVDKGALSKLDSELKAKIFINKLKTPHTLQSYKNKLYLCSSSQALLLSLNQNNKIKLEYKGLDAFMRGVLVINEFLYIGYSFSLRRTNSKFVNPVYGILKINRNSGEAKKIDLPQNCNNIISIISAD